MKAVSACVRVCVWGGHQRISAGEIIGKRGEDLLNAPTRYTPPRYVDLEWNRYLLFIVVDEVATRVRKDDQYGNPVFAYEPESRLAIPRR